MPYFKWIGITLEGKICKGSLQARCLQDLDAFLLEKKIALLKSTQYRTDSFYNPITLSMKITFFKHLIQLMQAGIFLDKAILVIFQESSHPVFKKVVEEIAACLQEGISLKHAMSRFPDIFDAFMIQVAHVGFQSGTMVESCKILAHYLEIQELFYKKLRSALLMPCITLGFFGIVTTALIIFVVPMMSSLWYSLGQSLPYSLKLLLTVQELLTSSLYFILIIVILICAYWFYTSYKMPKRHVILYAIIVYIPYLKTLQLHAFLAQFFQSLGILLERGIATVKALEIIIEATDNQKNKKDLQRILQSVQEGISLQQVLREIYTHKGHDIQAMLSIGYETGSVGGMLKYIGLLYQEEVAQKLHYINTLAQPMCMIIIGILVLLLVGMLYVPLFNLSHTIH